MIKTAGAQAGGFVLRAFNKVKTEKP